MNYLQKIHDYFIENNIPVYFFSKGESDNHWDNKIIEIIIEINHEDVEKWQYFISQTNSCGKIIESYYDEEKALRFIFSGNNEPYLGSILQENAKFMLEKLEKKYYTVSPNLTHFSVLVKPTHRCNLNCKYCYDKPFRDTIAEDMSMETLDSFVKLLSEYTSCVQFIWHGGEPTMVGTEWFERAYKEIFSKYPMLDFDFQLMSNGINLNPQWFELFKKYNIKAGMSYNAHFQDRLRPDNSGHGTELEAILLYSNSIGQQLGVIDVITALNYKNQIEIYEYYKKNKISICLNHVFHTKEAEKNKLEVSAQDYSKEFLKYFRHWLFDKDGETERSAMEALGFVIGSTRSTCEHRDCRNKWMGINPLGDIYPCDRYFSEKYKMGNISEFNRAEEIFQSLPYQTYCTEIQRRFDTKCEECGYWLACGGGCNGSAYECSGNLEGIDEFSCELFRLNFDGVYDILRKVSIFDKNLNPHARDFMVKHAYYSVREIKSYIEDAKVTGFFLEYDKENLLQCSEYEVFRGVNFIKEDLENMAICVDFTYSNNQKTIKANKRKHKENFYRFLKGVALDAAKK